MKAEQLEKIIDKQEELIDILDRYFVSKTRPSMDELIESEELKSELAALKSQGQKMEEVTTLLSSVIIKPTCIETHGGENEAYLVAMELLRKRFILFALGTKDRTFRIELHLEKQ